MSLLARQWPPVSPSDTAGLDVEATDAEGHPLGSQKLDQAQPPMVVLASYRLKAGTSHDGDGQNQTVEWDWQNGGSASVTPYQSMNSGWFPTCCDPYIPPDGLGLGVAAPAMPAEGCVLCLRSDRANRLQY